MNNHKYVIIRIVLALLLAAGIFGVQPAKAETVGFGWVQSSGGTNLDYGTAIALNASGDVYVSGLVLNVPANQDGFLNKWDANGNFVWSRFFAGPSSDASHAVALDVEGNVYVSGVFSATVEFDPGNSVGTLTSAGLADAFLAKFDGDGNFIWVKSVGGTSSEAGNGLVVDSNSNVYMTGSYSGTSDFDPGEGISNLTSTGSSDIFICKFDGNGNFIWAKSMGGPSHDTAFDITVNGTGDVFFTGYFTDTADFDPSTGIHNLTSAGGNDLFINKLDGSGNLVWVKHTGGLLDDTGIELALDGDGNIVVTGFTANTGAHDILVNKWDGDGNFLWAKGIEGTGWDTGYGIAVDGNDNIYITGDFSGTVDFDPGTGTSNLASAGAGDIFIDKLDRDGNFIWAKGLGGTGGDLGEGIALDGNGNLYLTGSYSETVDFDPGPGMTNLTSAGSSDVFITKLNLTPRIHYVKWNATGANNGSSWEDAYTDLKSALSAASNGDEIWVAAGTYKPTSTTDRTISFTLKNGVAVYGGFAGTETARTQRDYETNLTVLSGDIGDQDDNSDNSYHVVVASDTNTSAFLDGFTITAGNANGTNSGGGMYIKNGSPRVSHVIFRDNYAGFGGGMITIGDYDRPIAPILTDVTFLNNSATEGGGLRNQDYSSPILTNVVFEGNSVIRTGGGMENFDYSHPVLTNVIFSKNTAGELGAGGGMFNWVGNNPTLTNVTFFGNTAQWGGGMGNYQSSPILKNVIFSGNTASWYGGGMSNEDNSNPSLTDVIFDGNTAESDTEQTAAGGMHNRGSSPELTNVTFKDNSSNYIGGGMVNEADSSPTLENVTFSGNSADYGGAMLNRDANSNPTLTHVTMSHNIALGQGGALANTGTPVITNSILWGNTGGEIYNISGTPVVTYSIVQGGHAGTGNLDVDPLLGPLQDNGGFTRTMALGDGSPAINAADDTICPDTDQRGVARPLGSHCDMGAYEYDNSTVNVFIGDTSMGSYLLAPQESQRQSYPGINSGPVKLINTDNASIMAAERVIYKVNGVNTSFSEMMGLPANQLDTTYWLPWYNNVDLDTQLRFANVSASPATVQVYIGDQEMTGSPFTLAVGESTRRSFPGVNTGPVKIVSDVDIVAAERVIYKVNGVNTSFSEMMALSNSQLDATYWLPWYNNVDLDTQLRIANVSGSQATVTVTIGGVSQPSFNLAAGESTRLSYPGVNNGPVKIVSTHGVPIVAAERVIYKVKGVNTSFSELMALPDSQLDTTYWLPWYNNVDLDTQLRFANTTNTPATVRVYIGGIEMNGSPFILLAGESIRRSFAGINNGPVKIVSDVPIVAAERVIYRVNGVNTSFSEMMGLPDGWLDATFWFPWYNNVDLDTQLRFGLP